MAVLSAIQVYSIVADMLSSPEDALPLNQDGILTPSDALKFLEPYRYPILLPNGVLFPCSALKLLEIDGYPADTWNTDNQCRIENPCINYRT